ncbi:glycoside hydrolase family 16 protein [Tulasnella calospora MUT 4182]|uniref:Glycoside hydrolase family 16 protein n=1 Tax=Tulasnella calospora MUT 4182 TaxID=1051891 RepID=A0A0C3Q3S6_9AGAM|nr:glycoside hydrolase family 16 protein [Tulasnella calospora MUT 4182]
MSAVAEKKPAATKQLTEQEVQARYSRYQNELQSVAQKLGELETEAEEYELVLKTLEECLESQPDRTCFRLIGGVLVERTVKDVAPQIKTNRDGIRRVIESLVTQYKGKEEEFQAFQREYNIRVVSRS